MPNDYDGKQHSSYRTCAIRTRAYIGKEPQLEIGGEISNSITSVGKDFMVMDENIRIRRLTPKECFRLMNFDDADFEKAEQVNSDSQLYKQAGNSIVVNCLVAIFGQMLDGKENVYRERKL